MENLNKFADKLFQYLSGAEIFLKAQLPDFVQQFVAYETWKVQWQFQASLAVLVILVALQVLFIILICFDKITESDSQGWIISSTGIVGTFFLINTGSLYMDMKKMEIAPKVYMVERARELIIKK